MTFILNFFYSIARFFGWLFHFVYNSRVRFFFYRMRFEFSTQLFKRDFKECGEGTVMDFPLIRAPKQISIGEGCSFHKGLLLRCYGKSSSIIIGNRTKIGDHSSISCCNRIVIGNDVRMGRMVLITDNSHGNNDTKEELDMNPALRPVVSKGEILIEDNVWVGDKVSIMPGVHIGRGSIIGSNAVVTKDIPPYSIAVGCPAKVIKTLEK